MKVNVNGAWVDVPAFKVTEKVNNIGADFFNRTETELTIPEGVTRLNSYLFSGHDQLMTLTIPNGITFVGNNVFEACKKLKTIIGNFNSVTSWGSCNQNTTCPVVSINGESALRLPSIVTLTKYAFARWDSILTIDLGANCTTIEVAAFQYCYDVTTFICRATNPPTLGGANLTTMKNLSAIYVPDASVDTYKNASNWSEKAEIIKPLSEYQG